VLLRDLQKVYKVCKSVQNCGKRVQKCAKRVLKYLLLKDFMACSKVT